MNTKISLHLVSFLLVGLFAGVSFLPGIMFAQTDSAGVGIIPAVIDPVQKFNPGDSTQFKVNISNLSGIDQTYYLSKRDIIGQAEGGVPIFAESSSEKTDFELSSWLTLESSELFIPAGEEREMSFTMIVPEAVAPGSHFGSVIVTVEPPEISSSGASIGYEVANIIHIRIAGEAIDKARIRQFSTDKYLYGSTNVEFSARVENEGNTLVKPTGPLEITNMFGKRVALLAFNDSQAGVFPKTAKSNGQRDFTVSWEDKAPGFGRYEALLSAVYGDDGAIQTMSSTVTFWILPMNIVIPALVVLGISFIILFIAVKLYVRRSLALATSGSTRRLVRSRRQSEFPTLLVIVSMLALAGLSFIVLLLFFA